MHTKVLIPWRCGLDLGPNSGISIRDLWCWKWGTKVGRWGERHVWFYNGEGERENIESSRTEVDRAGCKKPGAICNCSKSCTANAKLAPGRQQPWLAVWEQLTNPPALIFIIREMRDGEQMQDTAHSQRFTWLYPVNLQHLQHLQWASYLVSGRVLMSISHKYQTLSLVAKFQDLIIPDYNGC